jgi:hypothetical protein
MQTDVKTDRLQIRSARMAMRDEATRATGQIRLLAAGTLLALLGTLPASAMAPASAAPSPGPLVPYMQIYAVPTGACTGGVLTPQDTTITVHVGQAVDFVQTTVSFWVDDVTWTFGGILPPDDVAVELGSLTQTRAWPTPGTYAVSVSDNAPSGPGAAITVVVVPETSVSVTARITADNSYIFGFGSAAGMTTAFPAVDNTSAGQIFGCAAGKELYSISAPKHGYLYIAAWSDEGVTQGVLGQFTRQEYFDPFSSIFGSFVVYTGDDRWQVYATGIDHDDLPGPTLEQINAQIDLANNSAGAPGLSSVGWVNNGGSDPNFCYDELADGWLAVSDEVNDIAPTNGTCSAAFGNVCGIKQPARWMWYDHFASGAACPFLSGGDQREFLIFRLPVKAVPAIRIPDEVGDPVHIDDLLFAHP